jgi:MFS family permease
MSTLTSAGPRSASTFDGPPVSTAAPGRHMVSGPLALVFGSEFCALTSFYLMLSVTPGYAAAVGAGSAGAGLVNAALLLGTVAMELAAPALMRRYGYWAMLAAGALLLGVPALALLAGGSLVLIVTVSVVRGVGFGLCTVMTGALTALLLPPERRGEGLGLFGIVATAPGIVALPAGVWLAGHFGIAVVAGLTAAAALAPLAAFPRLRGRPGRRAAQVVHAGAGTGRAARAAHSGTGRRQAQAGRASTGRRAERAAHTGAGRPDGLLAGLRHAGELRPFLIFAASTVAAGVVVSFLPLAAGVSGDVAAAGLLVQALTATVSRWLAGRIGDRKGHARLLVPALAMASAGMVTMIWLASPAAVIAGMLLFGTGFGICQNATFVLMIDRMPPPGAGTASALWNLAYDAGYGAGPALFGLLVSHTGYPAAFAMTAALMLAVLPAAWRERSVATTGRAGPG